MVRSAARCPAPEFIQHPALREVVDHWLSLLDDDELPDRRRLDPSQMRLALPCVWLCQRERSGGYRMRLAGAEINGLVGQPLRGRKLDEVLNENEWEELKPKLDEVLETPALIWSEGALFAGEPQGPLGECVMMPLRDHGRPAVVLGATVHGLQHVRWPGRLFAVPSKTIEVVPLTELCGVGQR